jgi:hypothetical protein
MTISSTVSERSWPGNGSAKQFDFDGIDCNDDGDFRLWITDDTTLVQTEITTNYSISLNVDQQNDPGGTLTYPVSGEAVPEGETLTLERSSPFVQETNLQEGNAFEPEVIEEMLDQAARERQELLAKLNRAAIIPRGSAYTVDEVVALLALAVSSSQNFFDTYQDALNQIADMVTAGSGSLQGIIDAGETSLNGVISAGETSLNGVISAGETSLNGVISAGETSLNGIIDAGETGLQELLAQAVVAVSQLDAILLPAGYDTIGQYIQNAVNQLTAQAGALYYDPAMIYNPTGATVPSFVFGDNGVTYVCVGENVQGDNPVGSTTGDWRAILSPPGIQQTILQNLSTRRWYAAAAVEANSWGSICWSPELSLFCAVASGGTNRVMTSPDGIAWTGRTAAEANSWVSICWSPELSLFCAVTYTGTNRVMTSLDGIAWTGRTAAEANIWRSICWSPELSLFCAVAYDGTNQVMTSPDGIAWTGRTAAEANIWQSVCWSPELSLFCAVSDSGTNRVMTSPDGITWTARTAAEANSWQSVCWSPELSLFCAVAYNGTNRVMTSPDGIAWTGRTAAEANAWQSICWSPELSLFCAVAYDGTNQVMTSPDGITWTGRTAVEANIWRSICWSPELSLFCAVSDSGTNRVMTSQ